MEATLAFPLFFFVIVGFLYFFQVFETQAQIQGNITEIAKEASRYGYLYDSLTNCEEEVNKETQDKNNQQEGQDKDGLQQNVKDILSRLVEGTYYKYRFQQLTGDNNNLKGVAGGVDGVSFIGSSFMEEDGIIEVVASYRVKIPVPFFSHFSFPVIQQVKTRGFIGTLLQEKEESKEHSGEDEYVYITKTGTVYHSQKSCTYLTVKIQCVLDKALETLRNKSGAIYYPCEECAKGQAHQQSYYITEYGDRYHTNKLCIKINHDIIAIKKSEVGSRKPCSKCYN